MPIHPLAALGLSALAALTLASCEAGGQATAAASAAEAAQAEASPAGVYAMPSPLASELRVVALPGRPGGYRVEVYGGGDPRDGAGIAADCQAVAEGRLQGDRIDAALVPFESDIGGLDASDLQSAPRLLLTLHGDTARLEGDFDHCAMGAVMAGTYQRTQTPRLMTDCAPLPAACWNRD